MFTNNIKIFFLSIAVFYSCSAAKNNNRQIEKEIFKGKFTDDYSIRYTINDTLFLQEPGVRYRILLWNTTKQYIIAKNGAHNPTEKNLYTRIDYMKFTGMEPYHWGFCYTSYKAASKKEALLTIPADRLQPKKGCNGFPYSRMKRIE
ncbi:MAG: hypothetical protein WKF35_03225 [Ferruginibacter sp.]